MFLRYWAPLLAYCCLVVLLSSVPGGVDGGYLWEWILLLHLSDGALHFIEYGILGVLSVRALAYGGVVPLTLKEAWLAATLFGVLFGAIDEIHQSYVPRRSLEFLDLLADIAGTSTMAAAYCYWVKKRNIGPSNPTGLQGAV